MNPGTVIGLATDSSTGPYNYVVCDSLFIVTPFVLLGVCVWSYFVVQY